MAAARRLGDDSRRDGNGHVGRAEQELEAELRSEDCDEGVLLKERAICRLVRGGSAGQSDGRRVNEGDFGLSLVLRVFEFLSLCVFVFHVERRQAGE